MESVKLRTVNRNQTKLATMELVGKMNLSEFCKSLRTQKGSVGRAAWDPQLLISVWVYAYSEGISSAGEIERLTEWEPGLQWLGGLESAIHVRWLIFG